MGDFYDKPHFTIKNFGGCEVGVENVCTKVPKGTPLRQIWSNKSLGVCGSDVVLTQYTATRKKVRGNRHWKLDVVYNTTSLPRRRDNRTLHCNGRLKNVENVSIKLHYVGLLGRSVYTVRHAYGTPKSERQSFVMLLFGMNISTTEHEKMLHAMSLINLLVLLSAIYCMIPLLWNVRVSVTWR